MQSEKFILKQKEFNKYPVLNDIFNLPDCPDRLWVWGNKDILKSEVTLSSIGSRKISNYGKEVLNNLIPQLSSFNITIVSGMAVGCDFVSQSCMVQNRGYTVGILGEGFDAAVSHPHYKDMKKWVGGGNAVFVSEFEPEFKATRWSFVKRNRLIAAMGNALFVVEAAEKSGTMHTVNFALELGKEVLAVPGNIYNFNSRGTNKLIQSGAVAVLGLEDILAALGLEGAGVGNQMWDELDGTSDCKDILSNLQDELSVNELSRRVNVPVSNLMSQLTFLELQGRIKRVGEKWVVS